MKWMYCLCLIIVLSGCTKGRHWNSTVSELLFDIRLQEDPKSILKILSRNSALQRDTILEEEATPGYHHREYITQFTFKEHPLFSFPFKEGIVSIDTSPKFIVLPYPKLETDSYPRLVRMNIRFKSRKDIERGFSSLITLLGIPAQKQSVDTTENFWGEGKMPNYTCILQNKDGQPIKYLIVGAGEVYWDPFRNKQDKQTAFIVSIMFFSEKPSQFMRDGE